MKTFRFLMFAAGGFAFFVIAFAAMILSEPLTNSRTRAEQTAPDSQPDGGGEFRFAPKDEITDEQRRRIQQRIQENIEKLLSEGKIAPASPQFVALAHPVRAAAGNTDFGVDAVSNFVDQNPAFPNQLTDYNCGTRSYDLSSGYNHSGIDYFTFPFGWKKMDDDAVEVVAAAPGTIVYKSDGNYDRSCGFNNDNWNAVYVRHADNSVLWYGHMKNNSVTAKNVGETVATGERLGVVGSSGSSTAPHLHLELYDSNNQLQDPYQGACNSLNNFSWWAQQPPYRDSRVNKLVTHSAPPEFLDCPQSEIVNEKTAFRPGENIIVAGYFRDQMVNQQSQFSIVRPDNTVYLTWTHISPDTYAASYWYYTRTLPADAPVGAWKFRLAFNSQIYERTFNVVVPTAAAVSIGGRVTTGKNGAAVKNARVTFTAQNGATFAAATNAFGYYRIANVPANQTFAVHIAAKRFAFAERIVTVTGETGNLDFTAAP